MGSLHNLSAWWPMTGDDRAVSVNRMLLKDFSDTARLSDDALRARFRSGDPQERVWCAWALGLRIQERATPLLVQTARADEDPGVRRHCVIMLAGAGELDLVAAIAAHDADEHVRATALQYVVRLLEEEPDALYAFVEDRLRLDGSAWVRAAAIQHLPEATPASVRTQVARHIDDADAVVREAAVERTLQWQGVTEALRARVTTENARSIRQRILGAWWRDDGKALLRALPSWPVALQAEALELGGSLGNADALALIAHRKRPASATALALRPR